MTTSYETTHNGETATLIKFKKFNEKLALLIE